MSEQSFTPAPPPAHQPTNQPAGTSGKQMALASMISGIFGLTVIPLIGSILGLVFANMAKKAGDLDATDNTYLKIGVITSWIGLGLAIATVVFVAFLLMAGLAIGTNVLGLFVS